MGHSQWWAFTFLIPVVSLIMILVLLYFPGNQIGNQGGTKGSRKILPVVAGLLAAPIALVVGWVTASVFLTIISTCFLGAWGCSDSNLSPMQVERESVQVAMNAMMPHKKITTVTPNDDSNNSLGVNTWTALPAGPGTEPLASYLWSATSVYFYCHDELGRITQQFDTAEACTKQGDGSPSGDLDEDPAPVLDRPFHVKVNQSALMESEALEIRFEAVVKDGRCIPVVECYLPTAEAEVLIRAVDTNSGEEFRLELVLRSGNLDLDTRRFGRHSVTLVDLLPDRTVRDIDASEYTVVILVSRSS